MSRSRVGHAWWRVTTVVLALAAAMAVATQAGTTLVVARDLPAPRALLVLGSHEWERLPALAELASQVPDAIVLLTEPTEPTPANCHRCGERVASLVQLGIDRRRVTILPRLVTNTYDEALAAREFCEAHALGTLMVVTSPYHTRRALATFDTVFRGSPTAVGMHPAVRTSGAMPRRWWAGAYDRAYVGYEWTALMWYAVRHRVSPLI